MRVQSSRRAIATASVVAGVLTLSSSLAAQVVVRGILYDDASGQPLRGTVLLVDPSTDAAVVNTATDSAGNFYLQTRDGTYQIVAIRPGYKSVTSAPVPLQNGERITIRVPMAENGDPVHRIGVTERLRPSAGEKSAVALDRRMVTNGFEARRAVGQGLQYDRTRLEKSGVATLGQFLQSVPGLQVRDAQSTASMQMTRSPTMNGIGGNGGAGPAGSMATCRIGWYLDGQRIDIPGQSDPMTDALASIPIDQLEAVEVFRGVSEMPPQFSAPDQRCGVVALWMRRG